MTLAEKIILEKARHIRTLVNAAKKAGIEVEINCPTLLN